MTIDGTNGDVISSLFYDKHIDVFIHDVNIRDGLNVVAHFDREWWDSPYKAERSGEEIYYPQVEGITPTVVRPPEPCEDAISRQAAIDAFERFIHELGIKDEPYNYGEMALSAKNVPPVTSQQKTGHWIQTNEFFINQDGQFIYKFICSECKSLSYFRKSNKKAIGANICPNCGSKMVEPQER